RAGVRDRRGAGWTGGGGDDLVGGGRSAGVRRGVAAGRRNAGEPGLVTVRLGGLAGPQPRGRVPAAGRRAAARPRRRVPGGGGAAGRAAADRGRHRDRLDRRPEPGGAAVAVGGTPR